ncbi:MAG: PIG-L family deacetylase [Mameliella sp.]|nr:PIG-L family deacetylase [Phaeodactylibacter sp.]
MKSKCYLLFLFLIPLVGTGQAPERWTATEIYQGIEKLNFLGSALYVAAHPDDENQRLIAYLANEYKAEMAYLSLTRGDGGQNLIGPEIREQLGVIRTQELLGARSIDGGKQMFSRANDFGYSKHPDETLDIWQREEVLGDVVWAIRKWRPDVIINRFDHESAGRTHGHHTTSAILSYDAFDLAGSEEAYPEQLEYLQPWQPRRLFFNTSWWFYGSQDAFAKADKTNLMSVDVGVYYSLRGKSNNEIAAEARSMHKCQGFGATLRRGSQQEYLKLLKGDMPVGKEDLFQGINTTWTRVEGGKAVGEILGEARDKFDFVHPYQSVAYLLEARKALQQVEEGYWKTVKSKELDELILACMGLYIETTAESYSATPGETVALTMEAINRSTVQATLKSVEYHPVGVDSVLALTLDNNQQYEFYKKLDLPEDIAYTNAYWLNKEGTLGMYNVEDQMLRGLPETPRALKVTFNLEIEGQPLAILKDVVYKETKPSQGETYRPFEITPPVFANMDEKVYVFADSKPQDVAIRVRAGKDAVKGQLSLSLPKGWRSEPTETPIDIATKSGEQVIQFKLYPPANQSEGYIRAVATLEDGSAYSKGLNLIEYDHIPTQTVLLDNKAKVVKVDIATAGKRIGYLMGAGDEIPNSLEQMGYEVTLLADEDISLDNLQQYDAIILGIRAYNTNERIAFHQPILLDYVKRGGTLINQYNTTWSLKLDMKDIAPYHLKISRDRVTVEGAPVKVLAPEHPVLNWPNKITTADFEGWVQERGLYFPNEWGEEFTAILSSNDPGEDPKNGGLLVAPYGEGYYIYSGYSWFRELPAGVPGAYRLFANLISIGKENR